MYPNKDDLQSYLNVLETFIDCLVRWLDVKMQETPLKAKRKKEEEEEVEVPDWEKCASVFDTLRNMMDEYQDDVQNGSSNIDVSEYESQCISRVACYYYY